MSIYQFNVQDSIGVEKSLADYTGKVLLIVNVASKCGFTPQYAGLQEIYSRWNHRGLEVLAFPCNQFGQQEPGTNDEIQEFCQVNYGVNFPVLAKIEVNGENAHPLYRYLTGLNLEGGNGDIAWNFTKFLVNNSGMVVKRFEPSITPETLAPEIDQLLNIKEK